MTKTAWITLPLLYLICSSGCDGSHPSDAAIVSDRSTLKDRDLSRELEVTVRKGNGQESFEVVVKNVGGHSVAVCTGVNRGSEESSPHYVYIGKKRMVALYGIVAEDGRDVCELGMNIEYLPVGKTLTLRCHPGSALEVVNVSDEKEWRSINELTVAVGYFDLSVMEAYRKDPSGCNAESDVNSVSWGFIVREGSVGEQLYVKALCRAVQRVEGRQVLIGDFQSVAVSEPVRLSMGR